jgi:hypothetical protein
MDRNVKKALAVSVLFAALYCAVWLPAAYPYRMFPTDDDYFRTIIGENRPVPAFSGIVRSYHPVLLASLYGARIVWSLFCRDVTSALLFHAVLSNAGIIALCGMIIFLLSRSLPFACVGMLLYASSPWPANYSFFYSYTLFATMLVMAAIAFLFMAALKPAGKARCLSLCGISCGLYLWSSSSAIVTAGVFTVMFACVFPPRNKDNRGAWKIFLRAFLLTMAPFVFSLKLLVPAIKENIETQIWCVQNAMVPVSLSFFRMLWVYNKLLLVLFPLLLFPLLFLRRERISAEEATRRRLLLIAFGAVICHALLIDALPSTKLGRTHFAVFPLLICSLSAAAGFCEAGAVRAKRLIIFLLFFAAAGVLMLNLRFTAELIEVKQSAPRYLLAHAQGKTIYVLEEDSHAEYLQRWLESFSLKTVKMSEAGVTLAKDKNGVLLIGPEGARSGVSILSSCDIPDFSAQELRSDPYIRTLKHVQLPYFAYFPSFQFESECCIPKFFSDQRVDYSGEEKNLKLFYREGQL